MRPVQCTTIGVVCQILFCGFFGNFRRFFCLRSGRPTGLCIVRRRDEHRSSAFAKQTIARRAIKQHVDWDLPPANCIRSECRTSDVLVPTAEHDRIRVFRQGSVVDPCWRVDTRPYEALRFGTLAQPISILPQGDRKFSILPFQFSIQQQEGGQSLAALP